MLAGDSQCWILKSSVKGSHTCTEIHSAEHTRVLSTRLKIGNGRNQIRSPCKLQLKLNGVLIDWPHGRFDVFILHTESHCVPTCGGASASSLYTVQQDSTVETHPFYYIHEPWECWDFFFLKFHLMDISSAIMCDSVYALWLCVFLRGLSKRVYIRSTVSFPKVSPNAQAPVTGREGRRGNW